MSEEPKLEELDRLISMGKQKGYLTYDEVNDALPSDIVSLDQLDDIMMMFGAMDIEVVDSAKAGRLPSEVRAARPRPPEDDDGDGPRADRPLAGPGRPHRGSGPPLPARDGPGGPAHARGRDRAGQADRGGQEPGHQRHPVHQPGAGALPRAARHPAGAATPPSRMSSTSTRRSSPRRRRSSSPGVVVNAFGNVDRLLRERDQSSSSGSASCGARRRQDPAARYG